MFFGLGDKCSRRVVSCFVTVITSSRDDTADQVLGALDRLRRLVAAQISLGILHNDDLYQVLLVFAQHNWIGEQARTRRNFYQAILDVYQRRPYTAADLKLLEIIWY